MGNNSPEYKEIKQTSIYYRILSFRQRTLFESAPETVIAPRNISLKLMTFETKTYLKLLTTFSCVKCKIHVIMKYCTSMRAWNHDNIANH